MTSSMQRPPKIRIRLVTEDAVVHNFSGGGSNPSVVIMLSSLISAE